MNPLDLDGPTFLRLFVPLLIGAALLSLLLRLPFTLPWSAAPSEARELSPYEIAYVQGGPSGVLAGALARLVQGGHLTINPRSRYFYPARRLEDDDAHPVERAVLRAAGTHAGEGADPLDRALPTGAKHGAAPERIRETTERAVERVARRPREFGLVLSPAASWVAALVALLPPAAVLLLGVAKVVVGLSRGRPVLFLVALCAVAVVVIVVAVRWRPGVTVRGRRLLAELRRENAALETTARRAPERLVGSDLTLAVGLFGLGVLRPGALSGLPGALTAGKAATASGASSADGGWFSSSWGSSCSSGSSCGSSGCGGGCGGGGCGGCGA